MEDCTQVLEDSTFLNFNAPDIGRLKVGSLVVNGVPHDIFRGDNVIGRDELSDIVIRSGAISNKHAVIEVEDWDTHLVYDCGSTNKTRLGKIVLKPIVRYNLQGDDELMFANLKAKYSKLENPQAPDADESGSETGSESMLNCESVNEALDLDANDSAQSAWNSRRTSAVEESSDSALDNSSIFEPKNGHFAGSHIQVVDASGEESEDDEFFVLPSQTVKEFKSNRKDKNSKVGSLSLTEDIFDPAVVAKHCQNVNSVKRRLEINSSKDIFEAETQDQEFDSVLKLIDGACEKRNLIDYDSQSVFNTEAQVIVNRVKINQIDKSVFEAKAQEVEPSLMPTQKAKNIIVILT
uniref:FHA domain-containing protein n=1 Tax=Graphocephala atropunctata TaxID=36148 RepID=A0A1B6KK36_9HEMI